MGGRFAFPTGAYYHASKYAVEAKLTASSRDATTRNYRSRLIAAEPDAVARVIEPRPRPGGPGPGTSSRRRPER